MSKNTMEKCFKIFFPSDDAAYDRWDDLAVYEDDFFSGCSMKRAFNCHVVKFKINKTIDAESLLIKILKDNDVVGVEEISIDEFWKSPSHGTP